jgi:hypothetical protein
MIPQKCVYDPADLEVFVFMRSTCMVTSVAGDHFFHVIHGTQS